MATIKSLTCPITTSVTVTKYTPDTHDTHDAYATYAVLTCVSVDSGADTFKTVALTHSLHKVAEYAFALMALRERKTTAYAQKCASRCLYIVLVKMALFST